jgi:hypothetical protein
MDAPEEALRNAVRGVDLDEQDERILTWLASCDRDVVEGVRSLLEKVREAGGVQILDLQNQIHDKARKIQSQGNYPEAPGNSGPGF